MSTHGQSLSAVPDWALVVKPDAESGLDRQHLCRVFKFGSFKDAMRFMADAVPGIEQLDHHPEWVNRFGTVEVRTTTHDAGDQVTDRDIRLARLLDDLFRDRLAGPALAPDAGAGP
jgi:4a-hydroxytetrahydrobiopterin dehydratase